MVTRFLLMGVIGFFSCTVFASGNVDDGSTAVNNANLIVADNPRKERRDNRQDNRQDNRDDKQDCRHEEGAIGHDKRDCKRDNRRDNDKDDDKDDDKDA